MVLFPPGREAFGRRATPSDVRCEEGKRLYLRIEYPDVAGNSGHLEQLPVDPGKGAERQGAVALPHPLHDADEEGDPDAVDELGLPELEDDAMLSGFQEVADRVFHLLPQEVVQGSVDVHDGHPSACLSSFHREVAPVGIPLLWKGSFP